MIEFEPAEHGASRLEVLGQWLRRRSSVNLHIAVYIIGLFAVLILVESTPASKLFLGLWMGLLVLHTLVAYGGGDQNIPAKAKRHRLELGDDGELIETDTTDSDDNVERREVRR